MTTNPYSSLYCKFPLMLRFLGSIPSGQFHVEVSFWNDIQTPLPKHIRDLHIIAIWSTKGRNCLSACNKNWLKDHAKDIPEAKWEINPSTTPTDRLPTAFIPLLIHRTPYPSALSTGKTPGLYKVNKLPSDRLHQTHKQGPQDKISTALITLGIGWPASPCSQLLVQQPASCYLNL
jgi:hypothetical protein